MKKNQLILIVLTLLLLPFSGINANTYSISGYVKDQSNGNVLVGANVFIEGTSIGTAADQKGFYEITNIKEGNYSLKASYIGYKTYSDSISLQGDEKKYLLDFNLNYTLSLIHI